MNIAESIIAILLIIIIVMTFITEPILSVQYFKAAGKSTGALFVKIKTTISDWMNDDKVDSEAEVNENV